MIKRMLDPNPVTRITVVGIKASEWFKHEYVPSTPDDDDEEEVDTDDDAFSIQELVRICQPHSLSQLHLIKVQCSHFPVSLLNGVGIRRREGQ